MQRPFTKWCQMSSDYRLRVRAVILPYLTSLTLQRGGVPSEMRARACYLRRGIRSGGVLPVHFSAQSTTWFGVDGRDQPVFDPDGYWNARLMQTLEEVYVALRRAERAAKWETQGR